MSLQHAANHLAAQGRHGDDMLVHMNRNEVAGLQALAQKHGKTLHTNPHTGMPEAFSLSQELGNATSGIGAPIIGAGISYLSGGTIDPMTAAAMVGGTNAVATGNLQSGLMAGLGAWGGASLTAGLSNIGTGALSKAAGAGLEEEAAQQAVADKLATATPYEKISTGFNYAMDNPTDALKQLGSGSAWAGAGLLGAAAAPVLAGDMVKTTTQAPTQSQGLVRPYEFKRELTTPQDMIGATYQPGQSTRERNWMTDTMTALKPYASPGPEYKMAAGGPVEEMSRANAVGANTGFPQADITGHAYATPWQTPISQNVVQGAADTGVDRMTGEMTFAMGGLSSLGGYAAGGNPRLLKGPGDGMSDNIPAVIGGKQPARLADGEFVVPADVVSHLGNGSTEAGAKQLYKMMDRIRQQRTGKKRQAPEVNPSKAMPA